MIAGCRGFRPSEACSYRWAFDGCYDVLCELSIPDPKEEARELRDGDPLCRRFLEYIDEREDEEDYECREDFMDCMGACSNCIEPVREAFEEMRAEVWDELADIAGVQDMVEDWGL